MADGWRFTISETERSTESGSRFFLVIVAAAVGNMHLQRAPGPFPVDTIRSLRETLAMLGSIAALDLPRESLVFLRQRSDLPFNP